MGASVCAIWMIELLFVEVRNSTLFTFALWPIFRYDFLFFLWCLFIRSFAVLWWIFSKTFGIFSLALAFVFISLMTLLYSVSYLGTIKRSRCASSIFIIYWLFELHVRNANLVRYDAWTYGHRPFFESICMCLVPCVLMLDISLFFFSFLVCANAFAIAWKWLIEKILLFLPFRQTIFVSAIYFDGSFFISSFAKIRFSFTFD